MFYYVTKIKKRTQIFLLLIVSFALTGCNQKTDVTNPDILPGIENYYYTFTANNKYFKIQEGLADYRDNHAIFSLKKLEPLDLNLEYEYVIISVSFSEKFYGLVTIDKQDLVNGRQDIMGEYGEKIKKDADGNFYGEISAFMKTKPTDFPTSIRIVSKICQKDETCEEIPFEIDMQKNE